jgi:NAD(P)-dependent dehydrogenase (short-subunit alcohol dehydrogenase family)
VGATSEGASPCARSPSVLLKLYIYGYLNRVQSSRRLTPKQLGGTVAFLCSPVADQITGTTIAVDGAWTAQ